MLKYNNHIKNIIEEELSRVLFKEDTNLSVTGSSQINNAISQSNDNADENGDRTFSTSVDNLNGKNQTKDDGVQMNITGENPSDIQQKVQYAQRQYPEYFNQQGNRVNMTINK